MKLSLSEPDLPALKLRGRRREPERSVRLYEMRPVKQTPAHRTDQARRNCLLEFAEI